MKAAAMSVWIFINLLCFGMCGYLYLIWSQYWMSIEKQRLFNKSQEAVQKPSLSGISYQTFSEQMIPNNVSRSSALANKIRRSVVAIKSIQYNQSANKSLGSHISTSNNVIVKSRGSPRFPNIHKPVLELDSEKYACNDYTTSECEAKTTEFKELLLKEFHRVLMSDSKVFTSGLDSQNFYDVKYKKKDSKPLIRDEDILCALKNVQIKTITVNDEPFASLGYKIPRKPLQEGRFFNTCAVVTSAGALRGSRLGELIDSHDMVLRFNNAPTENFTDDVGSKTTFRVLNSQVVTRPEFSFLKNPLYFNTSILIWDPANYSSTLEEWYQHPDFPLFPVYKQLLEQRKNADIHLINPSVLWQLWAILQDFSVYRLRRNPPSSGFIGLWFAMHRCNRVRMFEYIPSVRVTRRCHYHSAGDDPACTLGAWHPLAQEKALAHRIGVNSDLDIFQRGFIDIPGLRYITCSK